MSKAKKEKGQVLSLTEYLKKHKDSFPPVSAKKAKEVINHIIWETDYDTINQNELLSELQRINPYILTLLCNSYREHGYEQF